MVDVVYKFNKTNYPINLPELESELLASNISSANLRYISNINETDPTYNLQVVWDSTLSTSDPDDKGTMDTIVNDHDGGGLPIFKKQLSLEVDDHASKRFANVLTYEYPGASGKLFSLTSTAQLHLTNFFTCRTMLSYPKVFYTKDNGSTHSVADSTDMNGMYVAMNSAYVTEMDLIETTKTNIDGAADADAAQTAADAYLDL